MKFKRQRREDALVDITSLIDVVFILLIFFMVTTTFNKQSRLTVDLPKASGQPAADKAQQIEVTIDRNGQYSVNDRVLVNNQLETLKRAIQTLSSGNTNMPFIITADANTAHQYVVRAMDAAGQMGFVHLSITTEKAQGE